MTSLDFPTVMRTRMRSYFIAEIDIARKLGVATGLVGRWLQGQATPAREDLPVLGSILGLSTHQLETLLGEAQAIDSTPRPPLEVLERAAQAHWDELRLLPSAFREAVLVAQLRVATPDEPSS